MSQHIDVPMQQSSVVNNLTTNDSSKALSAAQGKALNDKYTALNSKLAAIASSGEFISNVASGTIFGAKTGNVCIVTGSNAMLSSEISTDTAIATLTAVPAQQTFGIGFTLNGGDPVYLFVKNDGKLYVSGITPLAANVRFYFSLAYIVA